MTKSGFSAVLKFEGRKRPQAEPGSIALARSVQGARVGRLVLRRMNAEARAAHLVERGTGHLILSRVFDQRLRCKHTHHHGQCWPLPRLLDWPHPKWRDGDSLHDR